VWLQLLEARERRVPEGRAAKGVLPFFSFSFSSFPFF
jgi:hypothetical protein